MYEWQLGNGIVTPVIGDELADIHRTRLRLMEPRVREALSAAGPGASAIDLACNEGWFSHRMLEWGAARVVGVDIRPQLIRRAELVRDHCGISPDRLELRCADVFHLPLAELGTFDVVLCLGLVYHLENPVGAIRIARELTRGVCVIESQLTRQTAPIVHGWGESDRYEDAPASFAARFEADQDANPLASAAGVISLIPNMAALQQAAEVAGFTRQELAEPASGSNSQFVARDRAVLLAWP
jgi:SAM-dependent methyltransferase